jgi:hypothetical protein
MKLTSPEPTEGLQLIAGVRRTSGPEPRAMARRVLCGVAMVAAIGIAEVGCSEAPADLPAVRDRREVQFACHPPEPVGLPVDFDLMRVCRVNAEEIVVNVDSAGRVQRARARDDHGAWKDCTAAIAHRLFKPATTCLGRPLAGEYRVQVPPSTAVSCDAPDNESPLHVAARRESDCGHMQGAVEQGDEADKP